MAFQITKEHVWEAAIHDRAGALAEVLRALREGGLNFEFIITRRDQPGRGALFIAPLRTVEEIEFAERVGFSKARDLHCLRVVGPNRPGMAAEIAGLLADEGINLRALSAVALGQQGVTIVACDTDEDVNRGKAILQEKLAP